MSTDEEIPALVDAVLHEPGPDAAGALRRALDRSGAASAVLPLLAHGLDAPSPEVRERAVRALAEIPDDAATDVLFDSLTHDDVVVRSGAALALAPRGVSATIPALIDIVVDGTNATAAIAALAAFATRLPQAEQIADRLAHTIRVHSTLATRLRLLQALAGIPGSTATRTLIGLTRDGDRTVAATAAHILRLRDDGRR